MKIGIPKGLYFYKYHAFIQTLLTEMGAEVVFSPDTNRAILDEGTKYCVDEACLPMKVFHGHAASLIGKCDAVFMPRFMGMRERESICPMLCGLPEMLKNNIPGLPPLIDIPLCRAQDGGLSKWADQTGRALCQSRKQAAAALDKALIRQKEERGGRKDEGYSIQVALLGHTYHINDSFVNMDLIKKLNQAGVGVITEEYADETDRDLEIDRLFKKPFWSFAKNYYGCAVSMAKNQLADGMIYLSSFSCGIDSVMVELIQNAIGDFPFLLLKLDEHTGEAGYMTRVEAFLDMLKRRPLTHGSHLSPSGQRLFCR